jgi:hypothetical protein
MQDLLKQSTSNASPPASLSAGQKSFHTERERLRDQQAQAAAPAAPTVEEIDKQQNQSFSKKRLGEGDLHLDQSRLEAAIKEEKRKREGGNVADEEEWQREKRRKYNSFAGSTDVTEEELEAYRRTRVASTEDPVSDDIYRTHLLHVSEPRYFPRWLIIMIKKNKMLASMFFSTDLLPSLVLCCIQVT